MDAAQVCRIAMTRLRSNSVRRHRHDKKRSTFRRQPGVLGRASANAHHIGKPLLADYGPLVVSDIVGAINAMFRSRLGHRGS